MLNINILIVEDDDVFCSYLSQLLADHDIFIAKKLRDAKAIIATKPLDIIFLDLNLPDGKGNEILGHIYENDPDAFVVIVTSDNKFSTVQELSKCKIAGYVLKPFTVSSIQRYLMEYYKIISDYI